LSRGAIVAIAVCGSFTLLFVIIAIICYCIKMRKEERNAETMAANA